jgi:predicted nucleic acid-binding protein
LIQKEKIRDDKGIIIEDRETMCKTVIEASKNGKAEIVTSALSLVEVCKNQDIKEKNADKIAAFFEHEFILLANLDRDTGERARELMLIGYSKLKPPDAVHVATAALTNSDEMHTFDGRLLDLDGLIDKPNGEKLRICKPDFGAPLPLVEAAAIAQAPNCDTGVAHDDGIIENFALAYIRKYSSDWGMF